MKRILGLLLALIMLLSAVPAFATTSRTSGLFTYELKGNGTAVITDFDWGNHDKTDIFIPQMLDGYTVTAIANFAFCPFDTFDEIKAYDGFQSWGKDCKIVLSDTITMIGDFAFAYLDISGFHIPSNLSSIGVGAFAYDNYCVFSIVPEHKVFAVIDNAIYDKSAKELISCPTHNGKRTIPEGIVSIGDYAFLGCYWKEYDSKALGINLPSTLRSVGAYAFYVDGSGNFQFNKIPDSVETIGDYAFGGSSYFDDEVVFSANLTSLGVGAFAGCEHAEFVINQACGLTEIPDRCFLNTDSVTVDFTNISSIGNGSLNTGSLTMTNTKGLKKIGENAFPWRTVPDFELSPQITSIPTGFNLTGFDLPNTVKRIESSAYMSLVRDFYLPSSITFIAEDAFVEGSTFVVEQGSYPEIWASENGFQYTYTGGDDLSWLNS